MVGEKIKGKKNGTAVNAACRRFRGPAQKLPNRLGRGAHSLLSSWYRA